MILPEPAVEEAQNNVVSVLIVDDHDGVRAALRDWIAASCAGVRMHEARDGEEALRLVERAAVDVVLMDIGLPGINGIEATRMLRQRSPAIAVVVISVHDGEAQRAAAVAAGAAAFVAKRRMYEELAPVLKPLLEVRLRRARAAGAPDRRSANNGA